MLKRETGINKEIKSENVFLILRDGTSKGIVPTKDAYQIADDNSLDLVKVGMNGYTPVCKIMDVAKATYEKRKQKKTIAKPKKVKQIEIRPNIEIADLCVKSRHINDFLKSGHKVKIIMKYKGREITHTSIGLEKIGLIIENATSLATTEKPIAMEGKNQIVILSPKNN